MSTPGTSSTALIRDRILREGRRPVEGGPLASYRARLLLGLALSVAVHAGVFGIRFEEPVQYIGWRVVRPDERIRLEHALPARKAPDPARHLAATMAVGSTRPPEAGAEGAAADVDGPDAGSDGPAPDGEPESRPLPEPTRIQQLKILEFAEQQPALPGGLSALYLRIDYPEAAIRSGIEGRVVMSFVVETDGRVSAIQVSRPAHPLLDSAAVRALRDTRFTPGLQNGTLVRVRMQLPVRFRLTDRKGLRLDSLGQPL